MNYKTEQEKFWKGEFGTQYSKRNNEKKVASNINLFSKIFENTIGIKSVLEFGANIGLNLSAIKALFPKMILSGVEINNIATEQLSKVIDDKNIYNQSILDFKTDRKRDLVFTKGVLIHINPDVLDIVYTKLYEYSNKYILVSEYYNPTPVDVVYRGKKGFLYKRDFAGELLEKYSDLELIN